MIQSKYLRKYRHTLFNYCSSKTVYSERGNLPCKNQCWFQILLPNEASEIFLFWNGRDSNPRPSLLFYAQKWEREGSMYLEPPYTTWFEVLGLPQPIKINKMSYLEYCFFKVQQCKLRTLDSVPLAWIIDNLIGKQPLKMLFFNLMSGWFKVARCTSSLMLIFFASYQYEHRCAMERRDWVKDSLFYKRLVASSGLYWSLFTFIQDCKAPA